MRDWIVENAAGAFQVLGPIAGLALLLMFFVFIPLGLFPKTRRFAAGALTICSYLFGALTWFLGVAITFGLLGWFWLIVGLLFAGIGVVPLAFIGALIKGQGGAALAILMYSIITYATRFVANYLRQKADMTAV